MRAAAFGALFSSLALLTLQAGDFSKSCTDISVSSHGKLTAECRGFTNIPVPAEIDLNERIANLDGKLSIVGSKGNFAKSCEDISIKREHVLEAKCKTKKGEFRHASIDLDDYVVNLDGHLMWDISGIRPIFNKIRNADLPKERIESE